MTKRLLLAIVCLLAISVTAGAQKRERKIKRIDRGVQEKVFIPKGQWLAGGSVSYSYFFADNMAAGFRFAYNRTYLDMPNLQLNLGDDLNISLEDLYYLQHRYDVSGFLRTYMPIGNSKIFGLFNELRLSYGYSTGKNSTGSGTEYDGTFEKANHLQIGIAPGLTAFVTNYAAVEVSMDIMGFDFKWQDQKTNQVETGKRRTSSGNFKIDLFSINIGMTFYL